MARANGADLDQIDDVLAALRLLPGVTEKKRGVFYRGRMAFVHFHNEDGTIVADAKAGPGPGFKRFALATTAQRAVFITALRRT